MSRVLQLGDEQTTASFRQDMMDREKHELVAMIEDATGREVGATRVLTRLLQRVAVAEDAIKHREAQWAKLSDQREADAWEMATGGNQCAIDVLMPLLKNSVNMLLTQSGKARTIMARFYADSLTMTLDALATDPLRVTRGGVEDSIAEQYYVICQMANFQPKGRAYVWFGIGRGLYKPNL